MSTYPEKLLPGGSSEKRLELAWHRGHPTSEACPESDVFGRLGQLHTDILGTAEVVKQVQEEVHHLRQENETLRRKLSLVELKGEAPSLRSSAGFASAFVDINYSRPKTPAAEPPLIQDPELELVLPFAPDVDLKEEEFESMGCVSSLQAQLGSSAGKASIVGWEVQGAKNHSLAVDLFKGDTVDDSDQNKPAKKMDRQKTSFEPTLSRGKTSLGSRESFGVFAKKFTVAALDAMDFQDQRRHGLRGLLVDPGMVKETLKQNIIKPEFNIARFYHTQGCAQRIVRSRIFENMSLVAIAANTIWIAVDTEHNREEVLLDADPVFQVTEHMFCAFFFFEIVVRFAAFEVKRNCMRSGWFIFDGSLVATMVFEDWIITITLVASAGASGGTGTGVSVIKNTAILRVLRLLRLARLGRCLKLARQSPEVMIMIKAMWGSMRCVMWTCVLLAALMFAFGVCFTSLCKGTSLEEMYFPSLTGSLHTLIIAGLFPDLEDISKSINRESLFFWAIFVFYLVVTTICVLNLLVGVLVEVVKSSSLVERDAMDVAYVKQTFFYTLDLMELDDVTHISVCKEEFLDILQDSQILEALTKVGIDVIGLVDLMDFIFINGAVGFADLLEIVLQMRSSADVTVKDVVEVRKFLTFEINKLKEDLQQINLCLKNQTTVLEALPR